MISEDQAVAMLAKANPIPDEDSLELIPDTTAHLVLPDERSSQTMEVRENRTETASRPNPGPLWVVAAIVAIVVVGVVAFLVGQSGESAPIATSPTTTTQVREELSLSEQQEAVGTLITAQTVEDLRSVVSPAWIESRTPPDAEDPELAFDEFWGPFLEAQQILGIERELQGCEQIDETTVQCTIGYSDQMTEALGQWPLVTSTPFSFVNGRIDMGGPTDNFLTAFERFVEYASDAGIQADLQENCPAGPFEPACASFVISNLEEWVAWEESNG